MDDRAFDRLAKAAAAITTRRSALAGLLAAAGAVAAPGGTEAGRRCRRGQKRCGRTCANVGSDPRNCGACGAACGEVERCRSGACVHFCTLNAGNTVPCGGTSTATAFCCSPEKGCCGDRCCS